jgi:malate permease and related proteins
VEWFIPVILDIGRRTFYLYIGILMGYLFIVSPLKAYRVQFIKFTMNILTPYLVFISILRLDFDSFVLIPIIISVLVTLIGIAIPAILVRFSKDERVDPAETCLAAFPNALNFPFPLIYAISPDLLGIAGIFLVTQIVLRNTIGLHISGFKFTKTNLIEILKFSPLYGILLGLLIRIIGFTPSSEFLAIPYIDIPFQIGIYATIMTLGFSLRKPNLIYFNSFYRVGISRFVISPILLLILGILFLFPAFILIPLIIQSAAPPAVYNGLYAERFGLDTELTTNVTVMLTLVALLLLPFEIFLIDTFFTL